MLYNNYESCKKGGRIILNDINMTISGTKGPNYGNFVNSNRFDSNEQNSYCLIIIDSTRKIRVETLSKDVVKIGRMNSDIIVSSPIVSKSHGAFFKNKFGYSYRDCGSLNGTIYNGYRVQSLERKESKDILLKDGDVLKIEQQNSNSSNADSVLIIFSTKLVSEKSWQFIKLFELQKPLVIGRNPVECDLLLQNMQVSRRHAIIYRTPNGFVLRDMGSRNGTIFNGNFLRGDYLLRNMDTFCIGGTKIIFSNGIIIFNKEKNGVGVEVRNISRVVKGNKKILDSVSLTINPSNLVAIIGGSGAGKSTFMNCINGFEPATSGSVLINSMDLIANYSVLKHIMGYVPQKDDLHDFLTVNNELGYTAKLRLSNDVSKDEIEKRVNDVMNIMGLSEHRTTLVKKLSGGQKKRVSIAMELVADPDIFFLDEPTSGLDPETETQLMKQLRYLATDMGKTIIVITHTLQNINLFDKIVFLAPGGKLCYYGTPQNAEKFFNVKTLTEAYEKVKYNTDYFVQKYNGMV